MKSRLLIRLLCLALSASIVTAAGPALAVLGERIDSIASDRKAISAVRSSQTAAALFTVEKIESDAVSVREYVSPSGVIFGIAWNGIVHPDLTQLLGAYAREYGDAARQSPRTPGRRYNRVKTDRIVVEKWGHMRNLRGRAYDPSLIPPGVTADDIR